MKLTGEIRVDFRGRAAKERGKRFVEDVILDQTMMAEEKAKRNVAPGRGPGPHPHRTPHEDTGELMASIGSEVEVRGSKVIGLVYTNVPYGTYLEVGWHARNGRFYRYPWLRPAIMETARDFGYVAQRHARVYFNGDLTGGKNVRVQHGHVPGGALWDVEAQRFRSTETRRFISRAQWEAALAEYHRKQETP